MNYSKTSPLNKEVTKHWSQNNTRLEGILLCKLCKKSKTYHSCKSLFVHYHQHHKGAAELAELLVGLQGISNQMVLGVLK